MSEHTLSPVVLEAFLRIYYSPVSLSGLDTPAVKKGLLLLENNDMIQREKKGTDYNKAETDYNKAWADCYKAEIDYNKAWGDCYKAETDCYKTLTDLDKTLTDYDRAKADYNKAEIDYNKARADLNNSPFRITPKGHAFLSMILSTPFPVIKAVDPQTEQ